MKPNALGRVRSLLAGFASAVLVAAALALWPLSALAEVQTARLGGQGRYETMAKIVGAGFQSSEWAVVAVSGNYLAY